MKPDGKLDLSIRGKIPEQMDADADKVFGRIEKNGGDVYKRQDPQTGRRQKGSFGAVRRRRFFRSCSDAD